MSVGSPANLTNSTGHDDSHGHTSPTIILFIFGSCALGALARTILKKVPVPYTVMMMIIGVVLGSISSHVPQVKEYTTFASVDPHVILHVFLPILIFESAFAMESHTFIKSFLQIVTLALPGLGLASFLTGVFSMYVFDYNFTLAQAMVFGCILSATDPVAVVALLKDLGVSKQLTILIEGESLLNDGAAIVLFHVFLEMTNPNNTVTGGYVVMYFVQVALGGPAFGFVMAKITTFWLGKIFNDALVEITITLASTYITFYVGESLLKVSGVLAVVVLGVVLSEERTSISPEVEVFLHRFWEMLAYLANTLIFMLVGVVIMEKAATMVTAKDLVYLAALYCAINVIRAMIILLFSPMLRRMGYGLSWQNGTVMTWAGLRGAVGLALALLVISNDSSSDAAVILTGNRILLHVAGIVVLTLLVNATTISCLLKILGMSDISTPKRIAMASAVRNLKDLAKRMVNVLKMDRFLADADWDRLKEHIEINDPYYTLDEEAELGNLTDTGQRTSKCPACDTKVPNQPSRKELKEIRNEARLRILKAQKTSFWRQFEHGVLSREAVRKLVELCEVAADTEDSFINIEEIKKTGKVGGAYAKMKAKLESWKLNKAEDVVPPPSNKILLHMYTVCTYRNILDIIIYILIVINMIVIMAYLILDYEHPELAEQASLSFDITNYTFIVIYIAEVIVKVLAFRKWYFKSWWNIFDIAIIVISIADIILDVTLFKTSSVTFNPSFVRVVKTVKLLRLLRSLRLVKGLIPQLISIVDGRINVRLRFSYDVSKGYVLAEEEVFELIEQMVENKAIAKELKEISDTSRLDVVRELGMLQKDHPGIAVSVKTQQAARRVLNKLRDRIYELRGEGVLDETEGLRLEVEVETQMKRLLRIPNSLRPPPPSRVVGNIPWISGNDELIKFIQDQAVLTCRNHGEQVMMQGDPTGGIFIVVSGMIKIEQNLMITDEDIKEFHKDRRSTLLLTSLTQLPHDGLESSSDENISSDYLTSGAVIGEMALLTGKPRSATVTCETAVQMYHLPFQVMCHALELFSEHPSLEYRLWHICALRIAIPILHSQPHYQTISKDQVRLLVDKAVLLPLHEQGHFHIDALTWSDVLLIYGVCTSDVFGRPEPFVGPCAIPLSVENIYWMEDIDKPKPVLLVVPRSNKVSLSSMGSLIMSHEGKEANMGSQLCLSHASLHRQQLEDKVARIKNSSSSLWPQRKSITGSGISLHTISRDNKTHPDSRQHIHKDQLPPVRAPPPPLRVSSPEDLHIDTPPNMTDIA